jgi:signal transduction histidine kinase
LQEAKRQLVQVNEELERRVCERTASLREAVQQMEEFSYTVSHDLRAPLRAMQAYSDALIQDFGANMGPEANRYLRRIADNATRLDRMILDVLTFSRVARSELTLEAISLDKLIAVIVEHYPDMQTPHAEIDAGRLDHVLGHEPSLMQAISNLLINAVKFVRPGTVPRVRIRTERHGEQVRLWIEDNGIGIEPKHHHRLFEMFERIHPTSKYEGTGVGLAIARKAVQRMGGKIGVESDGANGSRFWIELRAVQG